MLRTRHSVTIGDQALSSLINFALTICVARTTSADEFGVFAIAFALFVFFLGLGREVAGGLLLVRYSRLARASGAWERGPLGSALLVALAAAAITWTTGLLLPVEHYALWLVTGAAIAAALLQDGVRYVAIATHRPARALRLDAVWAVVSLPAMAITSLAPGTTLLVIGEWALGAAVAAAVGVATGQRPDAGRGLRWLRTNSRLARTYALEYGLLNGANLAIWFLLVVPLAAAQLGGVRGALFLFSPLNPLFSAMTLAVLPALVAAAGSERFRELAVRAAVLIVGGVLLYAIVVVLLPDAVGRAVLGDTWAATAQLRLPAALHHVLVAAYTVLLIVFRAREDLRGSLQMRAVFAAGTVLVPVLLAFPLGASGAAAGLAIAALCAVLVGSSRCLPPIASPTRKQTVP